MAGKILNGNRRITSRRMRPPSRGEMLNRRLICAEAARIMAEESVANFHTAKRKAANRLNVPETKNLPTNQEVEAALHEYLHLFHSEKLTRELRRLREIAAEAMRFLAEFEPRLVGSVLSGTVTAASEIHLHLCADTSEEVALALKDAHIPFDTSERRIRFGGERYANFPAYRFVADTVNIELCVFSRSAVRETPLSPVDGKPMRRAPLREVEELVSASKHAPD